MNTLSGGCLCERVRYKVSRPPLSQGICYCRQCQKVGGGCGNPLMVLHGHSFDCSLERISFCRTKSERGSIVTRSFCRECGSHIFAQISDIPNLVTLRAGTLDDLNIFVPEYLVWTRSAGPTASFPAGVPAFSESAPIEVLLRTVPKDSCRRTL